MRSEPTVVSLFTGCGGVDLGFEAAGFRVVCAVEKEAWACATLRHNHPKLLVLGPPDYEGRVENLSGEDIFTAAKLHKGDIDVVVGGPPCQPFSQAATQRFLKTDPRFKRRGFADELRGTLLFHFVRLVLELEPRAFLLENVPGIISMDDGVQLELALAELRAAGFSISQPGVLEAADYGVPQFRKRMVLWGSRTIDEPRLPERTHGKCDDLFATGKEAYTTVAHALVDLDPSTANHITRDHKAISLARYKKLRFGERDTLGRADRLDPYRPSKTVIAGGISGGGRSHLHPFVARTLSVRECARLQTFPDSFIFRGSTARQFTQVGNAVPPLLGEHLARQILAQEFGATATQSLRHAIGIENRGSIEELAAVLLKQALAERPDWVYRSHKPRLVHAGT